MKLIIMFIHHSETSPSQSIEPADNIMILFTIICSQWDFSEHPSYDNHEPLLRASSQLEANWRWKLARMPPLSVSQVNIVIMIIMNVVQCNYQCFGCVQVTKLKWSPPPFTSWSDGQPSPFVVWRFGGRQVGEGETLTIVQVTRFIMNEWKYF